MGYTLDAVQCLKMSHFGWDFQTLWDADFFSTCCVTCMKNINQQIHQTVAECTYHTKQHTASRKGLGYNMNNDVSG